jgi:hypothetical protein
MKTVVNEEFTWPTDQKSASTKSAETIKRILEMLGGNTNFCGSYVIVFGILDTTVDTLYPGIKYTIVPEDNRRFTWKSPKSSENADDTIKEALKLAGMDPQLYKVYFIAKEPGGRSLHYDGDGYVHPGEEYFLRVI